MDWTTAVVAISAVVVMKVSALIGLWLHLRMRRDQLRHRWMADAVAAVAEGGQAEIAEQVDDCCFSASVRTPTREKEHMA
ncbi:hypothetical protein [Streptomyces sp. SBT349]|uniref:hypothetical protein n=1 Tax=Streptomyces sp. SBT349 TaxID=1580539 RepID=UPI00131B2E5D|nr:hypothetical protein [Streptomyces sp. SBT349]